MAQEPGLSIKRTHSLRLALADRRELACFTVLLIVTLVVMYPMWLGERPVTGDHSAHYFKTWLLENRLLPKGELFGWTDKWFAGYPANYHYPLLADVLVALLHKLSFGLLDLSQAYGIATFLAYGALGYAVYRFLLPAGRWPALLAGVLMLADHGPHPQGGWDGTVWMGVWPCSLSIAFGLFALGRLHALMLAPSRRQAGALGLLVGISLLAHPFQSLHLGLGIPVMVLAHLACRPRDTLARALPYALAGTALGIGIGLLWLVPFVTASLYATAIGRPWYSVAEMAWAILRARLFEAMPTPAAYAGLLALPLLLRRRSPLPLFCGLMIPILLLFAARDAGQALLALISPHIAAHMEPSRIAMLLKPYWYMAGGVLALRLMQAVRDGGKFRWPALAALAATGLYIAANLPHGIEVLRHRTLVTASQHRFNPEADAFVAWAHEQAATDAKGGGHTFYRIAFDVDDGPSHAWLDLGTRIEQPMLNLRWTSSLLFRYMPRGWDPETLRQTNVRYLLTRGDPSADLFEYERSFGEWKLYAFKEWYPYRISLKPRRAKVRVKEWSDERIVLVSNSEGPGGIRLNMAYFPHWHATLNGKAVSIGKQRVLSDLAVPRVELHKGRYVFTFRNPPEVRMAALASLLCAVGCVALMLRRRASS